MRTTMVLLTFSLLLAACSGGNTPEATFEAVKSKVAAKDWGGFYDLIAPSARKQAEARWEEEGKEKLDNPQYRKMFSAVGLDPEVVRQMSLREFFVAFIGKLTEMGGEKAESITAIADAVVTDKKVEGDRATLLYEVGDREEEIRLVKEGGSWYVGDEVLGGMPGGK